MPDAPQALAAALALPLAPVLGLGGSGQDPSGFDEDNFGPGFIGFVVTFSIVVVVLLLLRDFVRRVRRLQLRGQEAEREAAERAAVQREAARPAAADPGPVDPGTANPTAAGPEVQREGPPGAGPRERGE